MVRGIYLVPEATAAARSVVVARAAAGRGLEGDRYFAGVGTWSYERRLWSDLTLVESEALAAAAQVGVHLAPGESRRNVVTEGVDLAGLIGRRFSIGEVELLGERACHPCRHLDRLTAQPAKAALAGRGGLRARILTGGALRVGARVVVDPGGRV